MLDVGCGTGALAIAAQNVAGPTGRVVGIDPGARQIARARAKAARLGAPIDFQNGVIEHLPFPDQSFDVVFSTLMMHHLTPVLKREGLAEMARVLKPEGRLVLADFKQPPEEHGDLPSLIQAAGFSHVEAGDLRLARRRGALVGLKVGTLAAGAALLTYVPRLRAVSDVFALVAGAHLAGIALVLAAGYALSGRSHAFRHSGNDVVEILTARAKTRGRQTPAPASHEPGMHKVVCPRCRATFTSRDVDELVEKVQVHARETHHHELPRARVLQHISRESVG